MNDPKLEAIKFWVIYVAFLIALVLYPIFLVPSETWSKVDGMELMPVIKGNDLIFTILSFVLATIATVIRWIVIPRVSNPNLLLQLFINGIAMAEAVVFFAIFLISPDQISLKIGLMILSLIAVLQMAPVFLKKISNS